MGGETNRGRQEATVWFQRPGKLLAPAAALGPARRHAQQFILSEKLRAWATCTPEGRSDVRTHTHTQSFKTWRRARPALRTACRWGTHSSSFRIWCRSPCDHIPAARSRWWRPCRCDTSFRPPPAELWHHLRGWKYGKVIFRLQWFSAGSLDCVDFRDVVQMLQLKLQQNNHISLVIKRKSSPIYPYT